MSIEPSELYRPRDVARLFRFSETKTRGLIQKGHLQGVIADGVLRVRGSDIEAFVRGLPRMEASSLDNEEGTTVTAVVPSEPHNPTPPLHEDEGHARAT